MEIIETKKKQKIEEIGKKYNLKLILLHGSYASGKARDDSDIDIAVLGYKNIPYKNVFKMHGEFAEVFGETPEQEIDIKSLYRADPLFLYQVLKNSQLLYGDRTDYNELRAYAFMNFYDSRDLFRLEHLLVRKFQNYLNEKYA